MFNGVVGVDSGAENGQILTGCVAFTFDFALGHVWVSLNLLVCEVVGGDRFFLIVFASAFLGLTAGG